MPTLFILHFCVILYCIFDKKEINCKTTDQLIMILHYSISFNDPHDEKENKTPLKQKTKTKQQQQQQNICRFFPASLAKYKWHDKNVISWALFVQLCDLTGIERTKLRNEKTTYCLLYDHSKLREVYITSQPCIVFLKTWMTHK